MAIQAAQYMKSSSLELWFNGAPVYDLEGFTATINHKTVEVWQSGKYSAGYKATGATAEGTLTIKKAVTRSKAFLDDVNAGKGTIFSIVGLIADEDGLGSEQFQIGFCTLTSFQMANVGSMGDDLIMEEISFQFDPSYATFKTSVEVSALEA